MKKFLIVAVLFAFMGGCPGDDATKPPVVAPQSEEKELTIVERVQRRTPVPQVDKDKLDGREAESKSLIVIGTSDVEQIATRKREDTLNKIKSWCFWIEISAAALAVIGAGLVIYFTKSIKLAMTVIALGALIVVGAYCVGWVLAHMGMIGLIAGIIAAAVLGWKVWEHIDELKDFGRVSASKIKDAVDVTKELADAKILNSASYNKMLAKFKK